MKLAIFASLVAAAASFAPSATVTRTDVTTFMAFDEEIGAQPPLGFWDPLGLLASADEERFNRLRYVEIKVSFVCGETPSLAFQRDWGLGLRPCNHRST